MQSLNFEGMRKLARILATVCEMIIQKSPQLLVLCCMALPADIRLVKFPHEDQGL